VRAFCIRGGRDSLRHPHARIRLGLSRDQLAHRLGISAELVEDWETGASRITCPAALNVILRDEESVVSGRRAAFGDPVGEPATRR